MNDNTPTTEEIREYIETGGEPRPWVELDEAEEARERARGEAFDRWLRREREEVRAAALREAAEFIQPWNYDRPDDWTEIARSEAASADALRTLAGVVTEEPEWEYGSEAIEDDGEGPRPLSEDRDYWPGGVTAHASEPDEDKARRIIAGWQNARLVRRRKAGPWVPVEQEGAAP